MANIPLTEKRFSEMLDRILEKRFNDMEERINIRLDGILEKRLDEKLKPIIDDLKEVKGFQKYEADAIELELQMVLKKHLSNVYPLMDIKPFEMKHISDPYTDNTITELDAAFLITPIIYKPDYKRLKEAGLPIPSKDTYSTILLTKFILAEAKHHINRNKVARKLWQFDHICNMFKAADTLSTSTDPSAFGSKFTSTVKHNKYLGEIKESFLFFGAAYWEKKLLQHLQAATREWKQLAEEFTHASNIEKPAIYEKIRSLESVWYTDRDHKEVQTLKQQMTDEQIMLLNTIDGAMGHIEFIYPSGDRYVVEMKKEPSGMGGGKKSRKMKRSKL
jgi:hypothetical protein